MNRLIIAVSVMFIGIALTIVGSAYMADIMSKRAIEEVYTGSPIFLFLILIGLAIFIYGFFLYRIATKIKKS